VHAPGVPRHRTPTTALGVSAIAELEAAIREAAPLAAKLRDLIERLHADFAWARHLAVLLAATPKGRSS
jgi:hypothetical protein